MAFWPYTYTAQHEIRTRTGDNRDMVTVSGYAVFDFVGSGSAWKHDDIYMLVGPYWSQIDAVAPIVSLASISNINHAVDAGWAVDDARWTTWGNRLLIQSRLAIRDSDGYMHRVAYHATIIGKL